MIKKLKIKFILLSMISLLVLLTIIVVSMNLINYTSVVRETDEILTLLSQNRGTFPGIGNTPNTPAMKPNDRLPSHMSPELPYESRYFSVLFHESGAVLYADISRIAAVDEGSAIEYARQVTELPETRGFINDFRFVQVRENDTVRVTFLDCGRRVDAARRFLYISIAMATVGYLLVSLVLCFISGKIIRPIAESYEKQKRFITDAGHEIKTPLTIINANVDLLEMEFGANESLHDITQQTQRLTALTNDLVYLARMEEAEHSLPMIDFPISEITQDAASPFQARAQAEGKTLLCHIQPMLSCYGNDRAVGQLVSILLDNALKYSATDGNIMLSLTGQNRSVVLTVFNATDFTVETEQLNHVFDRFYRTDPSRNSETGGHGIGLSIAHAIVHAHGGKIHAWTQDSHSFGITVSLPI